MSPANPYNSEIDHGRAVIKAVANAENTHPEDLKQPLYEAVDPDALDMLFADREGDTGRIVFQYHGYIVTVKRNGQITLEATVE